MLTISEKSQLDQSGIVLLKDLISVSTTSQLRERALELAIAEQKAGQRSYLSAKRKRTTCLESN